MRIFRSMRVVLMALMLCVVPASSFAGVFISVNFAPPLLPVYDQPPCPEDGWMWIPGYWAYGEDGYYWVPGTWVPAPYEGALWTPGYWGWGNSLYIWHPGYWGDHVGYYGGVNYGFGYMGIGFLGGMWFGHEFRYNRAYERVDERYVHNIYEDRRDEGRYTVRNDRRVAFSGGPGGIDHRPAPQELMANRDRHVGETSFQQQHQNSAMQDRGSFARNNGGRPANVAVQRPLGGAENNVRGVNGQRQDFGLRQGGGPNQTPNQGSNQQQNSRGGFQGGSAPANGNGGGRPTNAAPQNDNRQGNNPLYERNDRGVQPQQGQGNGGGRQGYNPGPQPQQQPQPQPQQRPQPEYRQAPQAQQQPQPQQRPQPEYRQARPMPESRPAPPQQQPQQQRSAPQGGQENRGRGR